MHKLLTLHDQLATVLKFSHLFEKDYDCLSATSAGEALSLLEQHDIAVLIADQRLNTANFQKASAEIRPHLIRLQLCAGADVDELISTFNSGFVHAHIRTPIGNEEMRVIVHRAILKYEETKRLQGLITSNARLQIRVRQSKLTLVRSLSSVLRIRDQFSHARGVRIGQFVDVLAGEFMLNEELREDLRAAATLQEIAILTECEVDSPEMNAKSAQFLFSFPDFLDAADIVRFQGENFDGSGQPSGLRGEQIPIASRLLRVASEYDSLTNPRAGALALAHDHAVNVLRREAGDSLDARVVETLSFVEIKERNGFRRLTKAVEVESISQAIH
jgi:response regulator RpfG family c-di-GMP phosphodiesterase